MACSDQRQLEQFLDHGLSDQEEAAIRQHLKACASCRDLLTDVEANLQILERLRGVPPTDRMEGTPPSLPQSVGNFKIIREIGRGGMGIVYEAMQLNPRRSVALKVLNASSADKHRVKLFRREARALARLQHPDIASICEAGQTENGHHYLVMELAEGVPLDTYVRQGDLPDRERMKLIGRIARAINHAHQRGVIHRDIKPSNILVDAEGSPRILDFGLARIVDPDATIATSVTDVGKLQGTLPYMSPEQLRGDSGQVDLRSDVYSLGVILYEVLAGRLPHDLHGMLPHEAMKYLVEAVPPNPSSVKHGLGGDLETVMLKALEKDPAQRYQSALALAEDMDRFLAQQPILARPPSSMYQLRKLVARHKLSFGFAAVFALLVMGFSIWMSTLYARARSAEQVAQERLEEAEESQAGLEAVVAFQSRILGGIDVETMGRGIVDDLRKSIQETLADHGARQNQIDAAIASFNDSTSMVNATKLGLKLLEERILATAAQAIEEEFIDKPLIEAELRLTIGKTYGTLGLYRRARTQIEQSLAIRRRELGDDHPDTIESLRAMSSPLTEMGEYAEALRLAREAAERSRRVLGENDPTTVLALDRIGSLLTKMGRHEEALTCLREAMDRTRYARGNDHASLTAANNMGALLVQMGKRFEALVYFREALEGARRELGADHPDTLTAINNVGSVLRLNGSYAEALQNFREALEDRRRVLGDDHPDTLSSISSMAGLLYSMGKYADASSYFREVLEHRRGLLGNDHPNTLMSIANMGVVLHTSGEYANALLHVGEALEGRRRVLGDEHLDTLNSINEMGGLLTSMGKTAEALAYSRTALESRRRVLGEKHPDTLNSIAKMGLLLQAMGRHDEARPYFEEALGGRRIVLGSNHPRTLRSVDNMGALLTSMGRHEEAFPYSREALEGLQRVLGDDHADTLQAMNNMAANLAAGGTLEEAEALYREVLERTRRVLGDQHLQLAFPLVGLAEVLLKSGAPIEAHTLLREALSIRRAVLPEDHFYIVRTRSILGECPTDSVDTTKPQDPPQDRRHRTTGTGQSMMD